MFYPNLPPSEMERFDRCLSDLADLFGSRDAYFADGLIALQRNLSFFDDVRLRTAVEVARPLTLERALIWRLHVMVWAAKIGLGRPGDFVECGVYEGFCSRVVAEYFDFSQRDRRYFLYDIFNNTGEGDGVGVRMPLHNSQLEQRVRDRFAGFKNVIIIAGRVPDSFAQAVPEQIAFLHIDMNNAKAEIAALEALWDRLSPGAPILFDDYGWWMHRAQMQAIRAFLAERDVMVMELPTGQGLALKP